LSVVRWSKNGKLKIGRFCSFAADTSILLGGEHRLDAVSTYPFGIFVGGVARDVHELTKGDVIIGNDVWVGNGAVILSGVTIGDGAVIGARSLVTRDVAPYSIVAGNPAKHIRMRFDEATVRSLLQIEWWNWSEEKIKAEAPHLASANMTEFMRRHAKTVLDPAE
jgi:acetyltransferase-like isoleucine patch superfamily enzyme